MRLSQALPLTVEPRAGSPFRPFECMRPERFAHRAKAADRPNVAICQSWPAGAMDSVLTLSFWPMDAPRIELPQRQCSCRGLCWCEPGVGLIVPECPGGLISSTWLELPSSAGNWAEKAPSRILAAGRTKVESGMQLAWSAVPMFRRDPRRVKRPARNAPLDRQQDEAPP